MIVLYRKGRDRTYVLRGPDRALLPATDGGGDADGKERQGEDDVGGEAGKQHGE